MSVTLAVKSSLLRSLSFYHEEQSDGENAENILFRFAELVALLRRVTRSAMTR